MKKLIPFFSAKLFWKEWKLNPGSLAYNENLIFTLKGTLNYSRLRKVLHKLISSHEIFRSYFAEDEDGIQQVVLDDPVFQIIERDFSQNVSLKEKHVYEEIDLIKNHVFDLTRFPLFRITLIKLEAEKYILMMNFHHIIVDAFTERAIIDFISKHYNNPEDVPSVQACLSFEKSRPVHETSLNYWIDLCQSIPDEFNQLGLLSQDVTSKRKGGFVYFSLDQYVLQDFTALSNKHSFTLFSIMTTLFGASLTRMSRERFWVFNYPVNARDKQCENLLGCYVHVFPIAVFFKKRSSFFDIIEKTVQLFKKSAPHQSCLFDAVLSELQDRGIEVSDKLFNLGVMQTHVKKMPLNLNDVEVSVVPEVENQPIYDLALEYEVVEGALECRINFDENLFDRQFVERLSECFVCLTGAMRKDIFFCIDECAILSEKEEVLFSVWNSTQKALPKVNSIAQLFEQQVKRVPQKPAIIFKDAQLTYQELDKRANCLARYILKQSRGKGSVLVPLVLDRDLDMVVALVAVIKSGCAYVPIDPDFPPSRISAILKNCVSQFVLTKKIFSKKLSKCISKNIDLIFLDENKNILKQSSESLDICVKPNDLAYVLHTSGSSGESKGVKISHESLINFLIAVRDLLKLGDTSVFLALTAYTFDILGLELYLPLLLGTQCVLVDKHQASNSDLLVQEIQKHHVNVLQATPAAWEALLKVGWYPDDNIVAISGGEALSTTLAKKLLSHRKKMPVWNFYGPTETTIWSTAYAFNTVSGCSYISIGKPIGNTKIYILDDNLSRVPIGVVGELCISGPGVSCGYLNDPVLTQEKFVQNPFSRDKKHKILYKTGDLVKYLPSGNVSYVGRKDFQIKYHGYRIELSEIELCFLAHPDIGQCVVTFYKVNSEDMGQLVVYYVLLDRKNSLRSEELLQFARARLPEYCVPVMYVLLEKLPLTSSGKVDRKKLPNPLSYSVEGVRFVPKTKIEKVVLELYQKILNVEKINIDDSFFSLGGRSLKAVELASKVSDIFSVQCFAETVLKKYDIQQLAAWIEGALNKGEMGCQLGKRQSKDLPVPLSFAQQRFLFLSKMSKTHLENYSIPLAWRIKGKLNVAALQKAINALIERHMILRTVYKNLDGNLQQEVLSSHDISLLVEHVGESACYCVLQEEMTRRFEFTKTPPFYVRLFQINADDYVFFVNMHHIVSDERSLDILVSDLSRLYSKCLCNEKSRLESLPLEYADFCVWQRSRCNKQFLKQQINFWRKNLSNYKGFDFPTDFPRPEVITYVGDRYQFSLDSALLNKIEAFGKANNVTVFNLLLSVLYVLLYSYSRQTDIVIVIPVTYRGDERLKNVFGSFINTLPLRCNFDESVSFSKLVEQVKNLCLEAFSCKDVPYEEIVNVSLVERFANEVPLLSVLSTYRDETDKPLLRFPDVDIDNILLPCVSVKSDLQFNFVKSKSELTVEVEYSTQLYERKTLVKIGEFFKGLARALFEKTDTLLSDVSPLTTCEKKKIFSKWNDTVHSLPENTTIIQLIEEQVQKSSMDVALIFGALSLTYEELNARANQLARSILNNKKEFSKNETIALCFNRGFDVVIGMLACLKLGVPYVPLLPDYPKERIHFILKKACCALVLTHKSAMIEYSLFDEENTFAYLDVNADQVTDQDTSNLSLAAQPSDLAYVMFTSGSTGQPKGVLVKHRALVNCMLFMSKKLGLGANDIFLALTSVCFDVSVADYLLPLYLGGKVVIASEEERGDGKRLLSLWSRHKVSVLQVTPTYLDYLLDFGFPENKALKLIVAGEPLSRKLVKSLLGKAQLFNFYGPTEATIYSTFSRVDDPDKITIGKPIDNVKCFILDASLNPVPVGVVGELHIGGVGLAQGYLADSFLTKEKFIKNPFSADELLYKTGDFVRWLDDGDIEYIGRRDNQVKIRGIRIDLGEIESCLALHPKVKNVVVLSKEISDKGSCLVAYIVLDATGDMVSQSDFSAFLRKKIPAYMLPRHFVVLKAMPLTPGGKVDKKRLQAYEIENKSLELSDATSTFHKRHNFVLRIFSKLLNISAEKIDENANFFDLGVHSMMLMHAKSMLETDCQIQLNMIDFFVYPSIAELSNYLFASKKVPSKSEEKQSTVSLPSSPASKDTQIAIIAMSGQFPGAQDVEEFWKNIRAGEETITHFSEEQLHEAGVPEHDYTHENYVKSRGVIKDAEYFDASFFGMSPYDAAITDPQQRLFLENAWKLLEESGYSSDVFDYSVGVFVGADDAKYLSSLSSGHFLIDNIHQYDHHVLISNNTWSFLSTAISYKLNLTGPSLNINTACSTSLVAVATACQSLLSGECDLAIAGAVSIKQPQRSGYWYEKEGITSADGHCRVFDVDSSGTVPGAGLGVVLLKRLQDALRDGDSIQAVIKGFAVNNDGAEKIGFAAPSIKSHYCIEQALKNAGVSADSIGYVEMHGTGTRLGDPVEVSAMNKAFGPQIKKSCAIGSVKSNIGHADAASGMAGLIKVVQMLKHKELPPSLHYVKSNAEINFDDTPFFVNKDLHFWKSNIACPRRAGVNSLGIGGTNAHLVLEEAPILPAVSRPSFHPWKILIFSAKTQFALELMLNNFRLFLLSKVSSMDMQAFSDCAYTLQVGRYGFCYRAAVLCRNAEMGVHRILEGDFLKSSDKNIQPRQASKIIFMFSDQEVPHADMVKVLYHHQPVFKNAVDRCCEILFSYLSIDFKKALFVDFGKEIAANDLLKKTEFSQPALFCIEYAMASLYQAWGVKPDVVVGRGVGEYVAAHLAGVFSLEDALKIVVARGKLIDQFPEELMLSVNSQTFQPSPILRPIISDFKKCLSDVVFSKPRIPFVSNIMGETKKGSDFSSPDYWIRHFQNTDFFVDYIRFCTDLSDSSHKFFVELGPGCALSSFVHSALLGQGHYSCIDTLPSAEEYARFRGYDVEKVYAAIAKLWVFAQLEINWEAFYAGEKRHRVRLPTYPFERKLFLPKKINNKKEASLKKSNNLRDYCYQPSWQRLGPVSSLVVAEPLEPKKCCLIFANKKNIGVAEKIKKLIEPSIVVFPGSNFKKLSKVNYIINPTSYDDYVLLINSLRADNFEKYQILHLWNFSKNSIHKLSDVEDVQYFGFYSVFFLLKAIQSVEKNIFLKILLVSDNTQSVLNRDIVCPAKVSILSVSDVAALEYKHCKINSVDITGWSASMEELSALLVNEMRYMSYDSEQCHLAYREGYRWKQTVMPFVSSAQNTSSMLLKNNGVYLILGGLGGVGLTLAKHIAQQVPAHIVLISRSTFPSASEWEYHLENNKDGYADTICALKEIQTYGAKISVYSADVANLSQMRELVNDIEAQGEKILGIIHAAGINEGGLITSKTLESIRRVLSSKLHGVYVLSQLFSEKVLDFVVLCSSLTAVTGAVGELAYCAANKCLDAFPFAKLFHSKTLVSSINWNAWEGVGMRRKVNAKLESVSKLGLNSIKSEESISIFDQVLQHRAERLIISAYDVTQYKKSLCCLEDLPVESVGQENDASSYGKYLNFSDDQLLEMFKNILGLEKIDGESNFFDLGGHSLVALKLISFFEKQFNIEISLADIYKTGTIGKLIRHIKATLLIQKQESPIVLMREGDSNVPPLFLIHPVGGMIFCYDALIDELSYSGSIYGIQDLGLYDASFSYKTLEDMAVYYFEQIKLHHSCDSYALLGYSFGGTVAVEVARLLRQWNKRVVFLGLIDSWAIFSDQFDNKQEFEASMLRQYKRFLNQSSEESDFYTSRSFECQWDRMKLLHKFSPKKFDIAIDLFKASELLPAYEAIDEAFNYWKVYTNEEVTCYNVPGNHETLLLPPHVAKLAKNLNVCLNEIMEDVQSS